MHARQLRSNNLLAGFYSSWADSAELRKLEVLALLCTKLSHLEQLFLEFVNQTELIPYYAEKHFVVTARQIPIKDTQMLVLQDKDVRRCIIMDISGYISRLH